MSTDSEPLRRWADDRSDAAFAELVGRHLPLVYSVTLRQTAGDKHLAEDVAQQVFADLARKAAAVARHPVLAGWLFTSTHHAAASLVRTERRLATMAITEAEFRIVKPLLDRTAASYRAIPRDAALGSGVAAVNRQLLDAMVAQIGWAPRAACAPSRPGRPNHPCRLRLARGVFRFAGCRLRHRCIRVSSPSSAMGR